MGPPERIIAGVVLCERLAVGMYGAVHRAQREGQRHLRALVVEPRLLAEPGFHHELLDKTQADKVISLTSEQIVPTLAIESEGPDVVVLTHGVGRYVTVQDMLASARARGFKIERSVVAAVSLAAAEALAAAHRARVVHGAVHPRSVLVDEEGTVRLTDFAVGRALTAAVAQGGDSALWRGLAGFLAPELAIGAAPGPQSDVFALGALVFVMLTGDAPPGSVSTTAAVERVVSKALDTDPGQRYRTPEDVVEALRVAFSTDGWAIASPAEIIAAAGLETESTGLDSDTEDLLAAMSSAAPAPVRPNMDLRAEVVAARSSAGDSSSLDDLLADLGEDSGATSAARGRDKRPTSDLFPSRMGSPAAGAGGDVDAPGRGANRSGRVGRSRNPAGSSRLAAQDPPPTMTS
ncbi:MAG TPA: protein kinase, partial [Kofleriaceae bacterium]|nr:protein kinase [Kofleriaceae bacterium]